MKNCQTMIIYNNKIKMEILLCQEREFRIDHQPSIYNRMGGQPINKVNWKR